MDPSLQRLRLLDDYLAVVTFATIRHGRQTYPGTSLPYTIHLATVANLAGEFAAEYRCCDPLVAKKLGWLHDVLEDTKTTHTELRRRFGRTFADDVSALSKKPQLRKGIRMSDSLARIKMRRREVWLVKIADRICNLEGIHRNRSGKPPTFAVDYLVESRLICRELGEIGGRAPRLLEARIIACRKTISR